MLTIDNLMWLAVAVSLYGNLLVVWKNQNGFLVWIVTNSAWVLYDLYMGIYSQAVLFLIYNLFAVYGYLSWRYPLQTAFYIFLLKGILQGKGKVK